MDKEKILAEIDDIALLEENWDGYGADPISDKIIAKAREVVDGFDNKYDDPSVVPSVLGIQFEWNHGDNGIEVYVEDDGELSCLRVDGPDFENWVEAKLCNIVEINKLLKWLYGKG